MLLPKRWTTSIKVLLQLKVEAAWDSEIKTMKNRQSAFLVMLVPGIGLVMFISIIPLTYTLVASFFDLSLGSEKRFIDLRNFRRMFTDPLYWSNPKNSVQFVVGVIVRTACLSLPLAVILNLKTKGRVYFRTIVLLPWDKGVSYVSSLPAL